MATHFPNTNNNLSLISIEKTLELIKYYENLNKYRQ